QEGHDVSLHASHSARRSFFPRSFTNASTGRRLVVCLYCIALPQDVRSENVQISYYLVGPFGGYGGYAAKQSGVTSYQIPTVIDGKAATEIRAIVYASGCEIQRLVIPLTEQSPVIREFTCQRVEPIRL